MTENEKPKIEFPDSGKSFFRKIVDFISGASIFLALIVSIIFIYQFVHKDFRKLKISLISNAQIINISDKIQRDELSMFYQNQKVNGLNYLKFQFLNSGDKAIRKEHIVHDIKLTLGNNRKIIDYRYSGNPNVQITKSNDYELLLSFDLLNSEQTFDLDIFTINKIGIAEEKIPFNEIKIDAAIEDLKAIDFQNQVDDKADSKKSAINKLISYGIGAAFLVGLLVLSVIIIVIIDEYKKHKIDPSNTSHKFSNNKTAYITGIISLIFVVYLGFIIFLTVKELF